MSQTPRSRIKWAALSKYSKLDISAEDLEVIPEEIKTLPQLTKLDVSRNRLADVECISSLQRISKVCFARDPV